jgi:SOS-response transcriptional repressor LexA
MKPKRKNEKPTAARPVQADHEYFQLPRGEFLVDEMEEKNIRHIGDLITNPSHRLAGRSIIRIEDDSMEGADIRPGDHVAIEKQTYYPEGCILAVQLGRRQLVRRYFRTGGRIHLECEPPSNQVIIVEDHTPDFQILGQVVQVIREIR